MLEWNELFTALTNLNNLNKNDITHFKKIYEREDQKKIEKIILDKNLPEKYFNNCFKMFTLK